MQNTAVTCCQIFLSKGKALGDFRGVRKSSDFQQKCSGFLSCQVEQYCHVRISKALLLARIFDLKTKQKISALLVQKSQLTIEEQHILLSPTCTQTVTIPMRQC